LEKKRNVTFDKLLDAVALGNREPEALESLAGRLVRLEKRFDEALASEVRSAAKGQTLCEIAQTLLEAVKPDKVEEASRLLALEQQRRDAAATLTYFDPNEPVAFLSGDLPHWRQDGATYFVTFRLADSLPQERLAMAKERDSGCAHPSRDEGHERTTTNGSRSVCSNGSTGTGSCVWRCRMKEIVEKALRHFDGDRYRLDEFAVAPNHVHVLVSPLGEHQLSQILHSWKSFTAHEILKVEAASRRLGEFQHQRRDASATLKTESQESGGGVPPPSEKDHTVWQKESFDHIVRSPASMEKFREYIRAHRRADAPSYLEPTDKQRREAAATLAKEAVAPLATNPALRQLLIKIHQASEQVIDVITRDRVLFVGASQQTTQNAEEVTKSFRDYIEMHKAEITALQLLYSRPYRHRLTEPMLKELEKKLREQHAAWTEDRLWDAFAAVAPKKVNGRSQASRFADLVALVRFALQREQVLEPFAQTVNQRFIEWIERNIAKDVMFTPEQRPLGCPRSYCGDQYRAQDFNCAPFVAVGWEAHQLFGEELPKLEELNEVLPHEHSTSSISERTRSLVRRRIAPIANPKVLDWRQHSWVSPKDMKCVVPFGPPFKGRRELRDRLFGWLCVVNNTYTYASVAIETWLP
jgi:REP element-mobilizing transposase RayT